MSPAVKESNKESKMNRIEKKEKRHITIDDLFRIKILNSPEISPNGDRIVFSYKWTDLKGNCYYSNLYMADLKSGHTNPFTYGEFQDLYPLWSPDGNYIIFRSDRNKKKGLWIIPSDGGEATPLMTEKGTLGEYVWSPDSKTVAYTFRKPDDPIPIEHISNDPEYIRKDEDRPYDIIEDIPYKSKSGEIKPKGKFHIHTINIESKEIKQITDGQYDDTGLSFSPDGSRLAFSSNKMPDQIQDYETNDIYILTLKSNELKKITDEWGPKYGLKWSEDGKTIYFTGHQAPKGRSSPEHLKIYKIPSNGGKAKLLTGDFKGYVSNLLIGDTREFDDVVQQPLFIDDEKKMIFCASFHGGCYLYTIPSEGGIPEILEKGVHPHDISYYSMDKGKQNMAVLKGDMLSPSEIYHYKRKGKEWVITQITSFNDFLKEETFITEPEDIWIKNSEGIDIQGWLLKPSGFNPKKKYPLVHQIHGGPHILYGYTFFHEMQLMAAKGYCVLFINPRGSKGYGTDFTSPVYGHWGQADTKDNMEFLDHIIKLGYIDERNLFVTGGSYGGYMTNWLVTYTDRYCAAASHRSISNMISSFGMSCGCHHFENAFGALPWKKYDHLIKHSPLFHVEKVKTPILIMHSENDNLTPLGEAEQFFVALRYLGKRVRFVRFKNETHELSRGGKPTNRRARLEIVLDWFEKNKRK